MCSALLVEGFLPSLCAGSRFELSRSLARLVLSSTFIKVKVETLNETSGEYSLLLKGILELNENKETGG